MVADTMLFGSEWGRRTGCLGIFGSMWSPLYHIHPIVVVVVLQAGDTLVATLIGSLVSSPPWGADSKKSSHGDGGGEQEEKEEDMCMRRSLMRGLAGAWLSTQSTQAIPPDLSWARIDDLLASQRSTNQP